jgi:hypothetical protein
MDMNESAQKSVPRKTAILLSPSTPNDAYPNAHSVRLRSMRRVIALSLALVWPNIPISPCVPSSFRVSLGVTDSAIVQYQVLPEPPTPPTMGAAASKPVDMVKTEADIDEKRSVAAPSLATPRSVDGSVALASIAHWESKAAVSPKTQLARTIFAQSDIRSLTKRSTKIGDPHVFNNELAFKTTPVTNQKSSGRCWLFATTNVLRYDVMKKLSLKEFQLSQVCRAL